MNPLRCVLAVAMCVLALALGCAPKAKVLVEKNAITFAAGPSSPESELRGMFVTTAYDVDWPSQAGLPKNVQQNEIDAVIIRAQELNCNTIFLQVRAFGDRLHGTSTLATPEHWSAALNFTHDPDYDPLGVWITKCHEQGIQIIAWVNPFRTDWPLTGLDGNVLPFYASEDGEHLWLDPTSAAVQDYVAAVMSDLLDYRVPANPMNLMIQVPRSVGGMAPRAPTPASTQPGGGGDDDGLDGVIVDHYFPTPDGGSAMIMNSGPMLMMAGATAPPAPAPRPAPIPPPPPAPPTPSTPPTPRGPIAPPVPGQPPTPLIERQPPIFNRPPRNTALTAPPTCGSGVVKPPNARIGWLLRKHAVPSPYVFKKEKTADDFIERIFNLVNGKDRIFAISPCVNQTDQPSSNAVKWLQKGWCHYFIPELYQHPANFKASLDFWLSKNTPPDPAHPNRKPLLIPALYSSAVEKPDSTGTIWQASEIEEEIDYARSKGVGQVHYSWRAMREHKHGGPKDNNNVGDDVKTHHYKDKSLIPPAMPPSGTVPTPTVIKGAGYVDVSSSGKVRQWAYWLEQGGVWGPLQTAPGRATTLITGSATKIRVIAIDRHQRHSARVEISL